MISIYTSTLIYSIIILGSIIFLIGKSFKETIKRHKKDPKRFWIFILIILIIAFYLRMFIMPHFHLVYCDDWYPLEIAHAISNGNFGSNGAIYEPQFIANALLYVPTYVLFGAQDSYMFTTAILISIASIFLTYLVGVLLSKDFWTGIYAAIIIAFDQGYLFLTTSTYNQVPSVLFTMLAIYFFLAYLRSGSKKSLYISLLSLTYLFILRSELIILTLFFALAYLINLKKLTLNEIKPWIVFGLSVLILIPQKLDYITRDNVHRDIHMATKFILPNLLNSKELLGFSYTMIVLTLFGVIAFVLKKNWTAIILFFSTVFLMFFYFLVEPEHLEGMKLMVMSAIYSIMAGYSISFIARLGEYRKLKKVSQITLILIAISLLGVGFFKCHAYAKSLKQHETINVRLFNAKIPDYIETKIPLNCTIVVFDPTRYASFMDHKIINIAGYNRTYNNDSCVLFIDESSKDYYSDIHKPILERFKSENNISIYGYIDSEMIPIPDKNLTINYTIYKIE